MAVKGASPVTFISEDTQPGKQFQVPLKRLTIDPVKGTIDQSQLDQWLTDSSIKPMSADATVLGNLLESLLSQGFLTKPTT